MMRFGSDQRQLQKIDGMDFIVISNDRGSKLSKKKKKRRDFKIMACLPKMFRYKFPLKNGLHF
jgi:hypothetical protein